MTLKAPGLSVFGRTLLSASHAQYLARMEAAQARVIRNVREAIPGADVRWRYHLVADGFAVVVPRVRRRRAEPDPRCGEGLAERPLPRAGGEGHRWLDRDRRQRALGREPRDRRATA